MCFSGCSSEGHWIMKLLTLHSCTYYKYTVFSTELHGALINEKLLFKQLLSSWMQIVKSCPADHSCEIHLHTKLWGCVISGLNDTSLTFNNKCASLLNQSDMSSVVWLVLPPCPFTGDCPLTQDQLCSLNLPGVTRWALHLLSHQIQTPHTEHLSHMSHCIYLPAVETTLDVICHTGHSYWEMKAGIYSTDLRDCEFRVWPCSFVLSEDRAAEWKDWTQGWMMFKASTLKWNANPVFDPRL